MFVFCSLDLSSRQMLTFDHSLVTEFRVSVQISGFSFVGKLTADTEETS
jgi:hypothetical protein